MEYDVGVDEATTAAPNVKQRTWDALTLLATQVPQLITPQVALIALDYSPFPQAMITNLEQSSQAPANGADSMAQAEVANLNALTALKAARAQKTRAQTTGEIQ